MMTEHQAEMRGFVLRSLERLRTKLLDLTKRNALLAFHHSARSRRYIRVVDELPDELFRRLNDGVALRFKGLPDPKDESSDEQTIEFRRAVEQARIEDEEYRQELEELGDDANERALRRIESELRNRVRERMGMGPRLRSIETTPADVAKMMGIDPSFDLPLPSNAQLARHTDNAIQTLQFRETMNRTLSGLRDQARSSLEETGINTLYCAFGFLEWFEDENSEKSLFAPLLLYPLELKDEVVHRGERQYTVSSLGDDAAANVTLAVRLKRDFGIELPSLSEDDTPESYFNKVNLVIQGRRGWRVRRWVTIGLFSFARIAMYQDLDPSGWPTKRKLETHDGILKILAGCDRAGGERASYGTDREYEINQQRTVHPLIIQDADSSQISAILDVMEGKDVVIEGPPGTGKSQTITNIIAAALDKRKTVLFVAEKMAALNVVSSRLKDAGLGHFCLELHSTKATRRDAIRALALRLNATSSRRGLHGQGTSLQHAIDEVYRIQEKLRKYVTALNTPVGALQMSVHDALWKCQRIRDDHPDLPSDLDEITVVDSQNISEIDAGRARDNLSTLAAKRQAVVDAFGSVRACPWFGVARPTIDLFTAETIVRRVRALAERVAAVAVVQSELADSTGYRHRMRISELRELAAKGQRIPARPRNADCSLLMKLLNRDHRERLSSFMRDCKRYGELRQQVVTAVNTESMDAIDVDLLRRITKSSIAVDLHAATLEHLSDKIRKERAFTDRLQRSANCARRLARHFGITDPIDSHVAGVLAQAVRVAADAPEVAISGRDKQLLSRDATVMTKLAIREWKSLREQQAVLEQRIRIPMDRTPEELSNHASKLRNSSIVPWFSRSYWAAKREYRSVERSRERLGSSQIAQRLEELSQHLKQLRAFNDHQGYRSLFGQRFQGLNTDFRSVVAIVEWGDSARDAITFQNEIGLAIRSRLFECSSDEFELIRGFMNDPDFEVMTSSPNGQTLPLEVLSSRASTHLGELESLFEAATRAGLRTNVPLGDCVSFAFAWTTSEELRERLSEDSVVAELIGSTFAGSQTPLTALEASFKYIDHLAQLSLPDDIVRWLVADEESTRPATFIDLSRRLKAVADSVQSAFHELNSLSTIDTKEWVQAQDIFDTHAQDLAEFLTRCAEHEYGLKDLVEDQRCESEAREQGLGDLIDAFHRHKVPLHKLARGYDRVLYQSLVKSAVSKKPELAGFSGMTHEAVRKRYKELDHELVRLYREKLVWDLSNRPIDPGTGTGAKSTWTELALVEHLTTLQRPRTSIREMLDRAGKAVQQLTPCFMMSPLSVSQFLQPGKMHFDLVVMDEASQLRPEDAIGAIARGSQLVIVGDPKQLPPTSFFDGSGAPSSDDGDDDVSIDESILDAALSVTRPARRLKWHYRSRHPSLISYSNHEFYDKELVTFPSPFHDDPDYGVHFVQVPGKYSGRVNMPEAQIVAERAVQFMRAHPNRSLGIVAMNQPQREILGLEFDRLFAELPEAEAYRRKWEPTLEPFFIKNLENVQGDERDAIFISTVFGRDEQGNFYQRFGPINGAGGHRRLNVLFSRAKFQTVLFTSMDPGDIRTDEASSWGLRVLKGFLNFAKTGHLDQPVFTGREPDSDFEISVARALRSNGYEVVPQVGVTGYFIDMAVRHPKKTGTFALGIECDGATYHSAKSVRDRDRLRQEVLERLGWRIHRIWSLDWFGNPKRETDRLLQAVRAAVA